MKIKHALLIFALGYCFDFIGAFEKILHMRYADFLLMIGMILKVLGVALFMYKIFTSPKAKDFLNW